MNGPTGPSEEPETPEDRSREPGQPGHGSMRPTSIPGLLGWAVVGAVGGWAVHGLCDRMDVVPPLVSWMQPLALWLIAALLGWTAWATHRAVHSPGGVPLAAQQAVNRLVLARASAIVCALVGGGYLGYALSWIGAEADLADERMVRSLVAAAGGLIGVVAALLLERACRVDDEE